MLEKVERSVLFPIVRKAVFVVALVLLVAMLGGIIFVIVYNGKKDDQIEIPYSEIQATVQPETDNEEIIIPEKAGKYIAEYYSINILNSANWIIQRSDSERRGWREIYETPQKVVEEYVAGNITKELFQSVLDQWGNWRSLFASPEEADAYVTNFSRVEDILVLWKHNWRNSFKDRAEIDNFLKNMSQIATTAERRDPENVLQYVTTYRSMYFEEQAARKDVIGVGRLLGEEGAARVTEISAGIEERINQFSTSVIKSLVVFGILFLFALFTILIALLSLLSIERNTRPAAAAANKQPVFEETRDPDEIRQ